MDVTTLRRLSVLDDGVRGFVMIVPEQGEGADEVAVPVGDLGKLLEGGIDFSNCGDVGAWAGAKFRWGRSAKQCVCRRGIHIARHERSASGGGVHSEFADGTKQYDRALLPGRGALCVAQGGYGVMTR